MEGIAHPPNTSPHDKPNALPTPINAQSDAHPMQPPNNPANCSCLLLAKVDDGPTNYFANYIIDLRNENS